MGIKEILKIIKGNTNILPSRKLLQQVASSKNTNTTETKVLENVKTDATKNYFPSLKMSLRPSEATKAENTNILPLEQKKLVTDLNQNKPNNRFYERNQITSFQSTIKKLPPIVTTQQLRNKRGTAEENRKFFAPTKEGNSSPNAFHLKLLNKTAKFETPDGKLLHEGIKNLFELNSMSKGTDFLNSPEIRVLDKTISELPEHDVLKNNDIQKLLQDIKAQTKLPVETIR